MTERTLTNTMTDVTSCYLATALKVPGYRTGVQLTLAKCTLSSSTELNKQTHLLKHTIVMPISPGTQPDSSPYSSTNILPRYRKHEWGLVLYTFTIWLENKSQAQLASNSCWQCNLFYDCYALEDEKDLERRDKLGNYFTLPVIPKATASLWLICQGSELQI